MTRMCGTYTVRHLYFHIVYAKTKSLFSLFFVSLSLCVEAESSLKPSGAQKRKQRQGQSKNTKYVNYYPEYLKKLLAVRLSIYNVKGTDTLSLPKPVTTMYGLHSVKYCAVKLWNSFWITLEENVLKLSFKRLFKTVFFQ